MEKIPALLITYNPSHDLSARLDILCTYFSQIILVDNGSNPETKKSIEEQVLQRGKELKAIFNPANLGVATALNQGFALAIQLGYEFLICLDQDSLPMPDMKNALVRAYQAHPNREKLAVLAPDIIEELLGKPSRYIRSKNQLFFERVACEEGILRNVSFVITSGSMYNLELYQKIGPFNDDFFIDAVDTEYCLRARMKGYEISVACEASIDHHLGNRQTKQLLGKTHHPTFHPPFRWYYINRNRVRMILLYGWRCPHWFFYEMTISLTSLLRMLLFEDQRRLKTLAILMGTWDGMNNRMGEISVKRKRSLATNKWPPPK
jgi:rhamnosyltransferase